MLQYKSHITSSRTEQHNAVTVHVLFFFSSLFYIFYHQSTLKHSNFFSLFTNSKTNNPLLCSVLYISLLNKPYMSIGFVNGSNCMHSCVSCSSISFTPEGSVNMPQLSSLIVVMVNKQELVKKIIEV
jgi:hypothetical protein